MSHCYTYSKVRDFAVDHSYDNVLIEYQAALKVTVGVVSTCGNINIKFIGYCTFLTICLFFSHHYCYYYN